MSDQVVISIAGSVISLVGVIVTAWIGYLMARLNKQAAVAAEQVKVVAEKLDETTTQTSAALVSIAEVGEANHVLLNSNMAVQLKMNRELSRWKADQTKNPADIAAADHAEKMYQEHESKQGILDARVA